MAITLHYDRTITLYYNRAITLRQCDYITLRQGGYITLRQGDYIITGRLHYDKGITLLYDRAITLHYDREITLPKGRLHYGTRMHLTCTYVASHEVTCCMVVLCTQNARRRQQFHVAGRPTSVCQVQWRRNVASTPLRILKNAL